MKKALLSLLLAIVCIPFAFGQRQLNSTLVTTDTTVCSSYTWINGATYTRDTTVVHFTDSIAHVLNLVVKNNIYDTNDVITGTGICSYTHNGKVYTQHGTFLDSLKAVNGCDSIIKLSITLNGNVADTIEATACDYYILGNDTIRESRTFDTTITNGGCEIARHISLTINPVYDMPLLDTIGGCNYRFHDTTLTDTGYFNRTVQTVAGCDSTIHLHISAFTKHYTDTTFIKDSTHCDKVTWHGATYNEDGVYVHDSTLINGCVRTYQLTLTLKHSVVDSVDTTVCDVFYWPYNDSYYYRSTTINPRFANAASNGCDSVGRLHLVVNNSPTVTIEGNLVIKPNTTTTLTAVSETSGLTYKWYVDNNSTVASTESTITLGPLTENTDVKLETKGNNECIATNTVTVSPTLGISGVETSVVAIYPNPTARQLNVSAESNIATATIFDAIGRKVATIAGNGTTILSIDLANLAEGNYTILVSQTDGSFATAKFIIAR